ncbi:MAG TPA: amino acid adenylation domain-containing protein, partial [Longimicrobium sp.]|nr:amino acid adenylation domain-containing protein [Longimicrobium sp.]
MTIDALLTKIHAAGIRLRRDGGELAVSGGRETLASDPSLIGELRSHKAALLDLVGAGDGLRWWSPPAIRPEMLPLVAVTQAEIDGIVAGVPGGAANVQDIYPLAPLQEGILFHHLLAAEGDPYLLGRLTSFDSRERVDAYLAALRAVIARHDILRTSIAWEGLREPVQVVWREAPLAVDVVEMEPAEETVAQRLLARFDPRHHRLDVRRAPLMHAYVAHDPANERWLLLLQEHHLISDHTTVEVLLAEIGAHLLGRQDQLPSPLPFRNFVAQARLGVSRAEHEAFFTNLLGDVEEPTAPFGLLDAWGDGSGIAEAKLQVDADVAARMRGAARKLGVSVASIGHVACAQVLARVSGREDVVFGTVLVGRMQGGEGADRVLGPFINTLPVRVRVGADGAEATVRRTHGLLADLLRHEHASLALAQRSSGVRAPAPLFSALLNYRHSAGAGKAPSAEARPGWAGIQRLHAAERSNYPLTLSMDDVGDGFWLTAQLPASAGPQRVCEMMHLALAGLVEALDQAPGRALASIDVLPPAERTQVVEGWNDTDAEYPSASSIHRVFETWAERSPDAVAVVSDAGTLTYAELNGRANRLARHLVDRGVDAGARVAILMPRSAELLVSELAILKAGAAYVPIDPTFPAERIAFMVADSGARVVLSRTGEEIPALESVERIGVDSLGEAADGDAADLRASFGGDALAYVMYTSGSTGEPKGVMVPHRAIARLAINNGYVDFGPGDRVAFAANPTFDASTMEVWGPLLNGGSIVVIPQDVLLDPRRFGEALAASGVTVLWMTVGLFNQYADELKTELGALRHLVVGGDALDPAVIARVLETNPPARLTNGYGPTETTTFAVTHRIEHVAEGARSIPLGRPISNTRVYVLDGAGEPAPAGVAGELHIGGAGVARGYLNRPGLTAERFVPDPFSAEPGARLYRTGDRTRWLADGTVEYLGRTDQQVKVRGFRIEPGEVEARLAEHPSVREAVVMAREDVPGEKRLVAYTVGDEVDAETLRAHLSGNLPEYMIPAAFVRLDALPLTANGKVDRRALPAPDGTAYGARGYEAPATAMESALAGIWGEVLGVERVGRHDHFFDLGGHSLLAVQLISRARQVLGTEVALGELFARPVLADFARVLEDAARAELPPIEPVDRSQPLALSFAQQRLWLLEQIGGVGGTYHVPSRLRLHGEMDRDALARALERIVARHEMLRATFHLQDGAPVQRIVPVERSGFSLADHDLAGHRQQEAELRRLTAEEAAAPFQLERGPLIRGRLLRLGAEDHVLLITMHHIVSDGWSMGVFVRELSALYGAFRAGEPDPLPELQIQYADYAAWQRRRVSGDAQGEEAEYWRTALAGVPELLELPTDHVRPARQSHAGAGVQVLLDEALAAGLKELSRRHGTTLFMTLLAGWAAVLGRLAGQDDVVIGTPTA